MKHRTWILNALEPRREYWLLIVIVSAAFITARAQDDDEYKRKAMFIYNCTQFVQWPEEAFNGPYDPLVIGILGTDPFGQHLQNAVSTERGNEHFIIIRRFNDESEIRKCHILFINKNDTVDMKLIKTLLPRHALLVSDGEEEFLDQGGMIRFVTKGDKIQLQINQDAIISARLSISSKMLRLAEQN